MADKNEEIQFLTRLGLNVSEARVYLTLVELNRATAKKITIFSKLARQEVYRVLGELEKKGLVERILAVPAEFKPFALEECLAMLIERQKKKTTEIEKQASKFLREVGKRISGNAEEKESQIVLINEKGKYLQKAKRMIVNSQMSLDVITTLKRFLFFTSFFAEDISKSIKRGVQHRIIIERPEGENVVQEIPNVMKTLMRDPGYYVRFVRTSPRAVLLIPDNKEVSIVTSAITDLEDSYTLWTDNPAIMGIVRKYFEYVWLEATESKLQESIPVNL